VGALTLALVIVVGYLLGSMPCGYWLPRAVKGVDIRSVGSGNTGAANVWRSFGFRLGLAVAVLDVGKGLVATLIGLGVAGTVGGVGAGVAALLGHWRPVFLRFARGGKVVATTGGVTLALVPLAALAGLGVWALVFVTTRYSSVASLATAASLPPLAYAFGADWITLRFTIGAAVAIVVLHRANIARLVRGEENRFVFSRMPRRDGARRAGGYDAPPAIPGRGRDT
jgi:glycerol-3-phosphate acyltransferase PlsY